mgnify:CR=1 FL=1
MTKITEQAIETLAIELLEQLGAITFVPDITRKYSCLRVK